ncbi:hypothetical protein GCM10022226_78740 [Sphaerisporangium flaviroseum]|uniref:NYN domain-containing protein n=1 Tax=Sphaerisporangium flaviroseum TaxID=509199 RepID=A0ABP7JFN1_9ACTN
MTPLRVGIFYDGGWFIHLWEFLADNSKWMAKPSFGGLHDVMRWYLHRELALPLAQITVTEAHYVLGRPVTSDYQATNGDGRSNATTSRQWDHALRTEGVIRHDVACTDPNGNNEAGADVALALIAHELAMTGQIDAAVLITGDADFLPLIHHLRKLQVRVIVPSSFTQADGAPHRVWRAPLLTDAADHAPSWESLLDAGLAPDYRLRYPFTDPVAGATSQRASDGYRYGTIHTWKPRSPYGFIRDTSGLAWFAHRDDLPRGIHSLPAGHEVRFNGRPRCLPGQKYPQARSIEPYTPDTDE